MKMHLIYGTDDNYYFPTAVSAASAAWGCARGEDLVIHLFDFGVSEAHFIEFTEIVKKASRKVGIVRHVIDPEPYRQYGAWRGSYATYSRMFVPDILPDDIDWAVYVDGDTLWLGDIGELFALRDDAVSILASIDPPTPSGKISDEFKWYRDNGLSINPKTYFCAGLILMDLKRMRELKMTDKCRAFLKQYSVPRIVDQTVLNYVLQGDSKLLPSEWGVFSVWHGGVDLGKACCVYYVNDLPWRRDKLNRLLSDVVMLWYGFCRQILDLDLLPKYVSPWGRVWRRGVFLCLRANQWMLRLHPYLLAHLRNTCGIPKAQMRIIQAEFSRHGA